MANERNFFFVNNNVVYCEPEDLYMDMVRTVFEKCHPTGHFYLVAVQANTWVSLWPALITLMHAYDIPKTHGLDLAFEDCVFDERFFMLLESHREIIPMLNLRFHSTCQVRLTDQTNLADVRRCFASLGRMSLFISNDQPVQMRRKFYLSMKFCAPDSPEPISIPDEVDVSIPKSFSLMHFFSATPHGNEWRVNDTPLLRLIVNLPMITSVKFDCDHLEADIILRLFKEFRKRPENSLPCVFEDISPAKDTSFWLQTLDHFNMAKMTSLTITMDRRTVFERPTVDKILEVIGQSAHLNKLTFVIKDASQWECYRYLLENFRDMCAGIMGQVAFSEISEDVRDAPWYPELVSLRDEIEKLAEGTTKKARSTSTTEWICL